MERRGEVRKLRKRLFPSLVHLIEPNFGLLEELLKCKAIGERELQVIRANDAVFQRNEQLLKYFKRMSPAQRQLFMEALDITDQSHVANWLKSNRNIASNTDCWPLSKQQLSVISENTPKLIESLDTEHDLLHNMRKTNSLSGEQLTYLREVSHKRERNEKLLEMMKRRSVAQFNEFITCLEKTQRHLTPYLTGDNALWKEAGGTIRPLDDEQLQQISSRYMDLIEAIDCEGELLGSLRAKNCITQLQKMSLQDLKPTSRIERLIQIMSCKSVGEFDQFRRCLIETGQEHVAEILRINTVVVHVRAELNLPSSGDVDSVETKIVSHLRSSKTFDEDESLNERDNSTMVTRYLGQLGVRLQRFFARKGNSINSMIICESVEELQILREHFESRLMEKVLQNVFSILADEPIVISRLDWTTDDFNSCVQQFAEFISINEKPVPDVGASTTVSQKLHLPRTVDDSTDIEDNMAGTKEAPDKEKDAALPHEIIEMILIKSTFKLYRVLSSRPLPQDNLEALTLTTLYSVCLEWWQAISGRKFVRRLIRRWFTKSTALPLELFKALVLFRISLTAEPCKSRDADLKTVITFAAVSRHWWQTIKNSNEISRRQLKQLFRSHPQLLEVIPVKTISHRLLAVTYCREMLFTLDFVDILSVFDGATFKLITTFNIKLKSMSLGVDMVSCEDTMQLFVAGYKGDIVRVDISSKDTINVEEFVRHDVRVFSMSLTRRRLLVTPEYINDAVHSLVVYDVVSGERLQSVQLPTFIIAAHSIETRENVFIVSHWGESRDHRALSEVNGEGHVTRAFSGLLHNPYYSTLDSLDRVLVIDEKYNVLLLSGDLERERVLLDLQQFVNKLTTPSSLLSRALVSSLNKSRRRLCYDRRTRRMFAVVNYENKIYSDIFILQC